MPEWSRFVSWLDYAAGNTPRSAANLNGMQDQLAAASLNPEQGVLVDEQVLSVTIPMIMTATANSAPFGTGTPGGGPPSLANNEVIFPLFTAMQPCYLTAMAFSVAGSLTNLTGSVYWFFKPIRYRGRRVDGTVSTGFQGGTAPTLDTPIDGGPGFTGYVQTTPVAAYEGIVFENCTFSRSLGLFMPSDLLAIRIAFAGAPDKLIYPSFSFKLEPA